MKVYECDECSARYRRITAHLRNGEERYFCSTKCMNDWVEDADDSYGRGQMAYYFTGQDITDGA
jgi:hypothetical protein